MRVEGRDDPIVRWKNRSMDYSMLWNGTTTQIENDDEYQMEYTNEWWKWSIIGEWNKETIKITNGKCETTKDGRLAKKVEEIRMENE